jgi:hypothetical protein
MAVGTNTRTWASRQSRVQLFDNIRIVFDKSIPKLETGDTHHFGLSLDLHMCSRSRGAGLRTCRP